MSQLILTLRDIVDGIRGQRGRFALSSLAVAIGVIALTLLIAVLTKRDRFQICPWPTQT